MLEALMLDARHRVTRFTLWAVYPFKRAVVGSVLELGGCLEICCWQMEIRFSLSFFFLEKEEKIIEVNSFYIFRLI